MLRQMVRNEVLGSFRNKSNVRCWALVLSILLMCRASAVHSSETILYTVSPATAPLQIGSKENPMESGLITEVVQAIFAGTDYRIIGSYLPQKRSSKMWEEQPYANILSYGSPHWYEGNHSEAKIFDMKTIVATKDKTFSVRTPSDLFNKQLIVILGFDYPAIEPFFSTEVQPDRIKVVKVNTIDQGLKMLDKKRAEAFMGSEIRFRYYSKLLGWERHHFVFHDFTETIPLIPIHLAFSETFDPEIQSFVNRKLNELIANGEVAKIIAKYR